MEILSKYSRVLRHETDEYKLGMKPINIKCLQEENMKTWSNKAMKYLGIKLMLRLKFFRRMDNST